MSPGAWDSRLEWTGRDFINALREYRISMNLQVKFNPTGYISNEKNNDWDSKQNQRGGGR
ncbi:hypothetical protein [Ferroplasma sp.]|uniref:hypothetical protein n=1 Tax=Ferroplasma sp. TaxID=2591003 RepID=UPI00307E1F43